MLCLKRPISLAFCSALALNYGCSTLAPAPSGQQYQSARALFEIGKGQFEDRKFPQAINSFNQSLKMANNQRDAKIFLALAYMETEKFKESEEVFKPLCEQLPTDGACWNNYSALKLRNKMPKEAFDLAERALKQTTYTTPELALGNQAKARLMLNQYSEALTLSQKAEHAQPQNCDIRSIKTLVLIRLKRFEEAAQNAKLATMQCPIYAKSQMWEAYALYKLGRHPQARDKFEYIMNQFQGSEIAEYALKALEKIADQIPLEEPQL